eukprot:8838445-Pyramimonas_sp.AAC.1
MLQGRDTTLAPSYLAAPCSSILALIVIPTVVILRPATAYKSGSQACLTYPFILSSENTASQQDIWREREDVVRRLTVTQLTRASTGVVVIHNLHWVVDYMRIELIIRHKHVGRDAHALRVVSVNCRLSAAATDRRQTRPHGYNTIACFQT